MAVYITTDGITSVRLMAMIKNEINAKNIKTWQFNTGTGFLHATAKGRWNKGGYLEVQPSKNPNELILYYKVVKGSTLEPGTYGVLNGRFIEMMMNHFKGFYTKIIAKDIRS
ncbi:hypothetical protein [Hymenobacter negativus]|uniref:Uncharacterized protein n=1 Tax=Hymenobacter negativus TaxID=2795026 RepID=A0ABS3QJB0_9BACT|nr:hypothetical protein [Hymenobacter negativus]MBO2011341.1 hypothetical protein [Hymenobacter negativus]